MSDSNRRDAMRIPCRISIALYDGSTQHGHPQINGAPNPGVDQILTYALDLSRTGAFIASLRPIPLGTPVWIDLMVGRGGGVRVEGVVIRTGPSPNRASLAERGVGVRFTRIDPAAVNYLASVFRPHR